MTETVAGRRPPRQVCRGQGGREQQAHVRSRSSHSVLTSPCRRGGVASGRGRSRWRSHRWPAAEDGHQQGQAGGRREAGPVRGRSGGDAQGRAGVALPSKAGTGGEEGAVRGSGRSTRAQPTPPPCGGGAVPPEACPQPRVLLSVQVTHDSRTYSVGVCTAAAGPDEGGCKDGGVCLLSQTKGASFGRLASMRLDYRHQDEAVILSYANGDLCPPGKSVRRAGVDRAGSTEGGPAGGESWGPGSERQALGGIVGVRPAIADEGSGLRARAGLCTAGHAGGGREVPRLVPGARLEEGLAGRLWATAPGSSAGVVLAGCLTPVSCSQKPSTATPVCSPSRSAGRATRSASWRAGRGSGAPRPRTTTATTSGASAGTVRRPGGLGAGLGVGLGAVDAGLGV